MSIQNFPPLFGIIRFVLLLLFPPVVRNVLWNFFELFSFLVCDLTITGAPNVIVNYYKKNHCLAHVSELVLFSYFYYKFTFVHNRTVTGGHS